MAYAITIHKSQGVTVDQAVVKISGKEFAPGLWYVACSRVTALKGLLFDEDFSISQVRRTLGANDRVEDLEYRCRNQCFTAPLYPRRLGG